MRELEDHNLNTCGYIFVALKRALLKCVWEDAKGFFVRNRVCKAILDLGILLATLDGRTMVCPVSQIIGIQSPLPARP